MRVIEVDDPAMSCSIEVRFLSADGRVAEHRLRLRQRGA
jgi:hypothetical protein